MRLRISDKSAVSTAITKCLEMVGKLDIEAQKEVLYHVDNALRCAAGLTSRVAVADAISSLCALCPGAFSTQGSCTNACIRLLNSLYFAVEQEKKDSLLKGKLSFAFGNVAHLAGGKAVRSLALKSCQSYFAGFNGEYILCSAETFSMNFK